MAKPTKKAPAKTAAKPSVKSKTPAKTPVKAAKPAKAPAKAAKPAPNAKPKKAEAASAAAPKKGIFDKVLTKLGVKAAAPAPAAGAKANGGKKAKGAKAPKGRRDEEEYLPEPEEGGGEDLPDLEEFDETEEVAEEEVAEETDVDSDDVEASAPPPADDEIILTDAEGRRYCKVKECDQAAMVDGYCRYHYLLLWKRIQVRRKILVDGKLERYVEELTARYPDKFLEMIRRDLKTEKDFQAAIAELEIDESANENEFEDEAQTYIDEVRGVTEAGMSTEEEEF
ncbi:MAG: hypothetical protein KF767_16155 [Bdellovibrionaceae bacterium]|nr:hypothetical protein [Pseudobdellovibrionaceae bacterium]